MKYFYLLFVCVLLSGCATRTASTYQEWKDKQEVKAQAARMMKAAEWVKFRGTKKD